MIDWSKFKPFADDDLNMANREKFAFDRVENIEEKDKMLLFKSLLSTGC